MLSGVALVLRSAGWYAEYLPSGEEDSEQRDRLGSLPRLVLLPQSRAGGDSSADCQHRYPFSPLGFLSVPTLRALVDGAVVYCSIIYWSIGLNRKPDRFLIFLVIVVLTALCSMSIGLSLSAFSPTAVVANALGPPFLIIFILFGLVLLSSFSQTLILS